MKNLLYLILIMSSFHFWAQSEDIHISTEGELTTHNDSEIGIFGNLNNDGNFDEYGGKVGFYNQNESQYITGLNAVNIAELIVNTPNDLYTEIDTNISISTEFSSGRVITPRDTPEVALNLIDSDLYFDENDSKHVDGYLSYTGNNSFSFPIGDEFRIRPLVIDSNAAENTAKAAYFYEDPNSPTTFTAMDTTVLSEELSNISSFEFWDLDGNTATTVTLTWDDFSNFDVLFPNGDINVNLTVVGWSVTNNQWENLGKTQIPLGVNQITSNTFIPNEYQVITFGVLSSEEDDGLEVFNGIFTDGSNVGPNSFFRVRGINSFPNNNLKIFNRWGVLVFEKDGYTEPENTDNFDPNEVFVGVANRDTRLISRSSGLPDGTYYYVLSFVSDIFGRQQRVGYLYLSGTSSNLNE